MRCLARVPLLCRRRRRSLLCERTSACPTSHKYLLVHEMGGYTVRGVQEGRNDEMSLSQEQDESGPGGMRVLSVR